MSHSQIAPLATAAASAEYSGTTLPSGERYTRTVWLQVAPPSAEFDAITSVSRCEDQAGRNTTPHSDRRPRRAGIPVRSRLRRSLGPAHPRLPAVNRAHRQQLPNALFLCFPPIMLTHSHLSEAAIRGPRRIPIDIAKRPADTGGVKLTPPITGTTITSQAAMP